MQRIWRDAEKRIRYTHGVLVFLVLAVVVCGHATSSEVRVAPCSIGSPGETGECRVLLDLVSPGLSEYEVQVTLGDPGIGEITGVRFPSWAGLNSRSRVPADTITLKGADTGRKVGPGDREVLLATLVIRGDAPGVCEVQVAVIGMKDESGAPYLIGGRSGTLTVLGPDAGGERPGSPGNASSFPLPADTVGVSPTPDPTPVTPKPEGTLLPVPTPVTPTLVMDGKETGGDAGNENDADHGTKHGTLCLDSIPGNALVVVDGKEAGRTPACLELAEGTHSIVLASGDGRTWEGDITVKEGQTLSLPPFTLTAPPRYILIAEAGPHGAILPAGIYGVTEGEPAEFSFLPDPGYRVEGVELDGVSLDPGPSLHLGPVTANHTIRVSFSPIPPPAAMFTANTTSGYAPLAVRFTDLSTGDVSGFLWSFGDGAVSSEPCPVHVYEHAGNYTVGLEVCGAGGCSLTQGEHFISVRERKALIADFVVNASSGPPPLMVQFEDRSVGDPDSWLWTFGDGNLSDAPSPSHLYTRPGVYPVRLTICADGCRIVSEKDGVVNVTPPVIGGSMGYFLVSCPVEGAQVFLDGRQKGVIENGTLTIPVYVTGTPARVIQVRAEGCLPYSAPITRYPAEGETVVLEIRLHPGSSGVTTASRFGIPDLLGNFSLSGSQVPG